MYPKNAASPEPIAIGPVVQISDGAVQTSGCTVRIKPIGVAEGDGAGTTAYSTDSIVIYTPTQAETNYTSFILIAKKTGCIPASITIVTTATNVPGMVNVGAVNSVSTSSVTVVNANIGTTEPTNFTGTGASALVKIDVKSYQGANAPVDANGNPRVSLRWCDNAAGDTTYVASATGDTNVSWLTGDAYAVVSNGSYGNSAIQTRLLGMVASNGTIGTGNTTTSIVLPSVTGSSNDDLNNWGLLLYDNSATRYYYTLIRDWTALTISATVDTLPFTPEDSTDLYWLLPVPSGVNVTRVGGTDQSAGTDLTNLASGTSGFSAIKTAVNNVQSTATQIHASTVAVTGEVADAAATTTVFKTNLVAVDDFYNDATITFTSGPLDGQTKPILDFAATNGVITLDEPLTSAPGNSIQFQINVSHVHPISQMQSGLATSSALTLVANDVTSVLADTNELQTDWANGGRLDLLIDAILADTDSLDTTKITTARAEVLTDWINGGRLDLILDIIAADTTTDIPALITALGTPAQAGDAMDLVAAPSSTAIDAFVLAALKRDWTGITGEAARSMLNALRHIRNKWSVSGSTLTVRKEDDTTEAWTSTLSTDAAADPITGSDPA